VHGSVSPEVFIAIAEEAGIVAKLGRWAIEEACRQVRVWRDAGQDVPRIAVNVSAEQFHTSALVDEVRDALEANNLDGSALSIEITEGVLMENLHETAAMLTDLQGLGLRVSIDDFGTGYSSLAYLKRLPIDELKIDRSFLNGCPEDADAAAIVSAIVAMSKNLGLRVVAEGVETEAQLSFLRDLDCEQYQGFFFSKPLSAEGWAGRFGK